MTTDQAFFWPPGLAKRDQTVFSDWKEESLQLRNSCTRQILEQERSANRMILQWRKYHTKLGDVNGTRIWVLSHQHLVPQSLGEAHQTQSQVSRVLALELATCTIPETSFSLRILSF